MDEEILEVKFYDRIEDDLLRFAVIVARTDKKWVMCKHRDRDSFEVPGGHREPGESILETARRELYEETGALDYTIVPVCVYSVTGKNRVNEEGTETYGMLYCANIGSFEPTLHSEMEKVCFLDNLPDKWTYPQIQPKLIKEVRRRGYF